MCDRNTNNQRRTDMRSESSRRKFLASAITAIALLLMIGNMLASRAESQTSQNILAKAGDTTQEKIARAMSAGPDNISGSARIIDTDAQGNKVILREAATASRACRAIQTLSANHPCVWMQLPCSGSPMPKLTNPSRRIQFPASPICWRALRSEAIQIQMTRPAWPSTWVPTG